MPPGENNDLLKHPQIKGLVNYAKKVEGDNFDKADSRVVIVVMMIMVLILILYDLFQDIFVTTMIICPFPFHLESLKCPK